LAEVALVQFGGDQ